MNKEENMWKPKILGIFNEGESQSALSREIEMLEVKNNIDNGMDLATRTYRVYDYIMNSIKEYGEVSQFKEDVLYIIHGLLERQLPQKELTATQIVIENRDKEIQIEKEKYLRKELEQKETILDKVTDKLKEVDKKYKNEYENIENMELSATKICVLQELSCVIEDIEEILSIIEGEKK